MERFGKNNINLFYTPIFAHDEYKNNLPEWRKIRHAYAGEREIKRHGQAYLPPTEGMVGNEYSHYLQRASFFNMVAKTANGLVGRLFQRPAQVENAKPKSTYIPDLLRIENVTDDGRDIHAVAREIAAEVVMTGRAGLLVDMDSEGAYPAYLTTWRAEEIIDWSVQKVNGTKQLTRVLLLEVVEDRDDYGGARFKPVYRELLLLPDEEGVITYVVRVHRDGAPSEDPARYEEYVPTNGGQTFSSIPFVFFGPDNNKSDVSKSPLSDIVALNLAHYRATAELAQGRHYTASPIYTVEIGQSDAAQTSYLLGPNTVWEIEKGTKASILEYNGHGLNSLENAVREKERQVEALGGRVMGIVTPQASDSDLTSKIKELNELSILSGIADSLDAGLTRALRILASWRSAAMADKVEFIANRSWLFSASAGARELRAIAQMYRDRLIPLETLHNYLQRAEVIPDWTSLEELARQLADPASFPGQQAAPGAPQ